MLQLQNQEGLQLEIANYLKGDKISLSDKIRQEIDEVNSLLAQAEYLRTKKSFRQKPNKVNTPKKIQNRAPTPPPVAKTSLKTTPPPVAKTSLKKADHVK